MFLRKRLKNVGNRTHLKCYSFVCNVVPISLSLSTAELDELYRVSNTSTTPTSKFLLTRRTLRAAIEA